jgi:hypothetical protein
MILTTLFQAWHLEKLFEQGAIPHMRPHFTPDVLRAMEETKNFITAHDQTGKILACGGVTQFWPGRGEAWAVFDPECKKHFLALHAAAKKHLSGVRGRVEAVVDKDFIKGHRWVRALGFELEAPVVKAYLPGGKNGSLYARVS